MRYEYLPDSPMEEAALGSNPGARALLDPFLPALQARAIITAAEVGLFEALGRKACKSGELAGTLSLNEGVLELLARVLASAGYLALIGEEYSLTALSRNALLTGSPADLSSWVRFNRMQWEILSDMEEVLRTGEGVDSDVLFRSEADFELQQRAMLDTARPIAPWVAESVPVPEGADSLLDLGGSHGLYGGMICRKHPSMTSTVMDIPEVVSAAEKSARSEGIDDVVSFRTGDILSDDLGSRLYDVVFLGNVAHHLSLEENRKLLARISAALKPGGTAAVWDIRYPEPGSKPDLFSDGFALFFRLSSSACCYHGSEITAWMKEAGFTGIDVHQPPSPTHFLITGRT
ncbi:MAG: methyltransferase [Actinobacteria bacterium]|nr:methyltransferase [Actinomycetota bacterium]